MEWKLLLISKGLVTQRNSISLSLHCLPPTLWEWGEILGSVAAELRTLTTSDYREGGGIEGRNGRGRKNICVHLHISCAEQKSSTISKRSLFLQNSSQRGKIRICINSFIFIHTERDFRQFCI